MKRSKFISNLKFPGIDIKVGQEWIRKPKVSILNNPSVIHIDSKVDSLGRRLVASSRRGRLYFEREDIIKNYELRSKSFYRKYTINEEIAEIKGWRITITKENDDLIVQNPKGERCPIEMIPKYSTSANESNKLFEQLSQYQPSFRTNMGSVELFLIINGSLKRYKSTTKPFVICDAFLDIFG